MSRAGWATIVCAAALTLTSCVVASPDSDTYRDAAASTLGTALSEVATTQKMLDLLDQGRIIRPTVVAQMRYSEKSLAKATDGFDALNPPAGEQTTARRVESLLQEAGDSLKDARQAVHRSDTGSYPSLADELDDLAQQLDDLESSVS